MEKENIKNWVLVSLVLICIIGAVSVIASLSKENKQLKSDIPIYELRHDEVQQHRYFGYKDVEFSSYVNDNDFYGLDFKNSEEGIAIYCVLDNALCTIELTDYECFRKQIDETEPQLLEEDYNCTKYYIIEGVVR